MKRQVFALTLFLMAFLLIVIFAILIEGSQPWP